MPGSVTVEVVREHASDSCVLQGFPYVIGLVGFDFIRGSDLRETERACNSFLISRL